MGGCSVRWCGKKSETSNLTKDGITFHRFPKNPEVKEKWIECTKRENWFPSNFSLICSRHFSEDCFFVTKMRRRLHDTAIPTLSLPILGDTTAECDLEKPSSSPSFPQQSQPMSRTPETTKRENKHPGTLSQLESLNKKQLCRRILQLSNQVRIRNKTIRILYDEARYYKRKEERSSVIIKELEKRILMNAENADIST